MGILSVYFVQLSTLNAALKWVEVPENHTSDIEKLLKELRD